MNPTPAPIDRRSHFWETAFLASFHELARRAAAGSAVLPGPELALRARLMADDAWRAREQADHDPDGCPACKGVGCPECKYTGRAGATEGLHPPPEPSPEIDTNPAALRQLHAVAGGSPLDPVGRAIAAAERARDFAPPEPFTKG